MKVSFKSILPFVAMSCLIGCGEKAPVTGQAKPGATSTTGKEPAEDDHGHTHGDGPHGGLIVDWGGGAYHVEFTVDHDKKEATVYILGSDEKTPAPIKAEKISLTINDPPTELELIAKPLEGETKGSSSRFVGTHDTLGIVRAFAGTITGETEGTPYYGDFDEDSHDDHKH